MDILHTGVRCFVTLFPINERTKKTRRIRSRLLFNKRCCAAHGCSYIPYLSSTPESASLAGYSWYPRLHSSPLSSTLAFADIFIWWYWGKCTFFVYPFCVCMLPVMQTCLQVQPIIISTIILLFVIFVFFLSKLFEELLFYLNSKFLIIAFYSVFKVGMFLLHGSPNWTVSAFSLSREFLLKRVCNGWEHPSIVENSIDCSHSAFWLSYSNHWLLFFGFISYIYSFWWYCASMIFAGSLQLFNLFIVQFCCTKKNIMSLIGEVLWRVTTLQNDRALYRFPIQVGRERQTLTNILSESWTHVIRLCCSVHCS